MNKKLTIILLLLILLACVVSLIACNGAVKFTQKEYLLQSGDKVEATGKAVFRLATDVQGVTVDEKSGQVTFSNVANGTQIVVVAVVKDNVVDSAICTLQSDAIAPTLQFTNLSSYLTSGGNATAKSTPAYSIEYSLKEPNSAIKINGSTGRVIFGDTITDGMQFTVVVKAHGATAEKTFTAVVNNKVTATTDYAISEYKNASSVSYSLNFDNALDAQENGVASLCYGNQTIDEQNWTYDKSTQTLTVKSSYVDTLPKGEHILTALTSKNPVALSVKVANFIATAEELAGINNSKESLADYYVLACDIDLTSYLSPSGKGYNDGKGWIPIGKYFDVVDPAKATEWAFKGNFDGNGHTIYGFFMDCTDEVAYNSGLFAYVDVQAQVYNLGVKQAQDKAHNVRSYSGGFVGVNAGTITNCWADVDMLVESFDCVGGFVGHNVGVIENCYSLGAVNGNLGLGCFSGYYYKNPDTGKFSNCYALASDDLPFCDEYDQSCKVFSSLEEMKAYDFSHLEGWLAQSGQLPKLPTVQLDYQIREIFITNTQTQYSRQDGSLQIQVQCNPQGKLNAQDVTFKITQGENITVDQNGLVDFSNFTQGNNVCIVAVEYGNLIDYFEFYIYENVQAVDILWSMEVEMIAGNSYKIDGRISPATANQQITYQIVPKQGSSLNGISLNGDIVTISPILDTDKTITIIATAVNGEQDTHDVTVVARKRLDNYSKVIYRNGALGQFTFTLPSGVANQLTKVTRYDKSVSFSTNGDDVTLNFADFDIFGNKNVPVTFVTATQTYWATVAVYDQNQVIEISSVEDFLKYKEDFNDISNDQIRKKIVVLTADLDFSNYFATQQIKSITAIGSSHLGTNFEGVFNGNGHTISNLKIDRNDFSGEYPKINEQTGEPTGEIVKDETLNAFHASRYNVGLFSYASGIITNVHFQNVTVGSYFYLQTDTTTYDDYYGNFVGVVAGTCVGEISNCTFTNCSVKPDYQSSELLVGTICGKSTSAKIYNCVVDGVIQN